MANLLPQMSPEPAPGYRRFVERHFEALRRDVRRLAGDGPDLDGVCCDVLADVALRWRWFELLRVRLRRTDPAGAYLGVALDRRIARWRSVDVDADAPREVEVEVEAAPDWSTGWPTVGWGPDRYGVDARPPADDGPVTPTAGTATSAAVRIAAVRPPQPYTPSAPVEAVIAWLHAYETYGRYRRVVAAAATAFAAAVLVKLRTTGAAL